MWLGIKRSTGYISGRIRGWLHSSDEMTKSRRNIVRSNFSIGAAANLVGGNFLTGFYLLLNADDAFIGLISIIMTSGNLLQVLSPYILERYPERKRLLITVRIVCHVVDIILIGLIPYLGISGDAKLYLLVLFKLFVASASAVMSPGFSIWHIKSIPEEIRAKFYSIFSVSYNIFIYIIILLASSFADKFKAEGRELTGLSYLRAGAIVFAVVEIYFLTRVKEYPNEQDSNRPGLFTILLSPFREKKYLLTVAIACLWSFAANFPGPFYSIYLLRDLGVSYSFLTLVNMMNIPFLIFLTPFWAKRINRTSWFKTLQQSMAFYLISFVCMAFVSEKTIFLYPVSMGIAFVFAPGINLVFSNIPYINMPQKNQTRFIGFYSTMNSLVALVSIVISRQFILSTAELYIRLFGMNMQNKQYIMLITALLLAFSTFVISKIRKNTETAK